ncbi:NIPA-like protein 2 isoform X2 [Lineus longissimus]|uniref:NIPA-like protein 2 isoform X2 n=1 Tax=Lineus longissimus TaxID=88925 RepID=UPI00315C96B8
MKLIHNKVELVYTSYDLLVGCLLAIGGNLMISVSLNVQKYSHMKNEDKEEKDQAHYTKSGLWWVGLILMGLGEVGNFSAYGFAPASLVAPLGTTTVIANMFLAAIFLKEKIRPEDLFGSAISILGAFLIVTFSSKKDAVLNGDEIVDSLREVAFIIYVTIELVALVILFVLLYKFKKENVLIFLLITSLLASFTVISAKAVSSMLQLTIAGFMQLDHWIFYVMLIIMVATAVIQVKYLNLAMKSFFSTVVVPTNFVFFTISAILAGIIFYREFWGLSALDIFMFLFGCILCFIGVHFITAGRAGAEESGEGVSRDKIVAEFIPKSRASTVISETLETLARPPALSRAFSCSSVESVPHQSGLTAGATMSAWLLSNINQAQVQPPQDLTHSSGERPIQTQRLGSRDSSMSTSSTAGSSDPLYEPEEEPKAESALNIVDEKRSYGATNTS